MGLIGPGERLSVKESRGWIDQFVGEGNVALLAVLLALKQSRKFQTGNRQSQPGRIQRGKTKSSRRGRWGGREEDGRWKGGLREERKGFIVDPASNAYSHVARMPIVCLTPSMDFLGRIQLKPTFIIAFPRNLSSSASLITLRCFSLPLSSLASPSFLPLFFNREK